jgi:hypothetical protein
LTSWRTTTAADAASPAGPATTAGGRAFEEARATAPHVR